MKTRESRVELESATLVLGRRLIETRNGRFEVTFFRDQPDARTTMSIACGDLETPGPLLARVHSSCVTSECLMACDCDCAQQLDRSLAAIARAGRGVVFYMMQEGRGAGLSAKARDRMLVQASGHRLTTFDAYAEMGLPSDLRRYDRVGPMARALGLRGPVELLTNNPEKAKGVSRALANEKIDVLGTRAIEGPTSAFNRDYLRAKRQAGHFLARDARQAGVLPPEPIQVEAPMRASGCPDLISTANYLLPVDLAADSEPSACVEWFRMRVIYDRRTARESVLLSLGSADKGPRENRDSALTLTLVDRLPCSEALGRGRLRGALEAIRDSGAGRVVVHFDDSNPDADRADASAPAAGRTRTDEILSAAWVEADVGDEAVDVDF